MNKKAASSIGLLTVGLFAIGAVIGVIFMIAGSQAGNVFYLKNDLYAKDAALLTNSALSLPTDADVVLQYPHDFQFYTIMYDPNQVVVSYRPEGQEKIRSTQPFIGNKNYELDLPQQDTSMHFNKLGNKITNRGNYELKKEGN